MRSTPPPNLSRRPSRGLVAVAILALASCQPAAPASEPATKTTSESAASAETALVETAPVAAAAEISTDIFAIPEEAQDFSALIPFVQEIQQLETEGMSEPELRAHQQKIARTVFYVAQRAQQLELSEEETGHSVSLGFQALEVLRQLGEPGARAIFAQHVERAVQAPQALVRAIGMKYFVEAGFASWSVWDDAARAAWLDKISGHVQREQPGPMPLQMLSSVVDFLSQLGSDALACELLDKTLPHFRQGASSALAPAVSRLEGISRRLNLPGNKIELAGELLDGSPLDWSAYRGKVVLVDFWATWCGACRAEVPSLLKLYEAYHEKGFDILGVSLDATPEEAQSYLEETKIPWTTLFSADEQERGWQHPLAVRYGINGIPQTILVDRDGTVLQINVRGEALVVLLEKLLGEPISQLSESPLRGVALPTGRGGSSSSASVSVIPAQAGIQ